MYARVLQAMAQFVRKIEKQTVPYHRDIPNTRKGVHLGRVSVPDYGSWYLNSIEPSKNIY